MIRSHLFKTSGVVKFTQGMCVKWWKNKNETLGDADSWGQAEDEVSTRDRWGGGCQEGTALGVSTWMQSSLQRDHSQGLPAPIIYLKNIIAVKGQDGIYGLESVFFGVGKNLRDFMVQ